MFDGRTVRFMEGEDGSSAQDLKEGAGYQLFIAYPMS